MYLLSKLTEDREVRAGLGQSLSESKGWVDGGPAWPVFSAVPWWCPLADRQPWACGTEATRAPERKWPLMVISTRSVPVTHGAEGLSSIACFHLLY